MTTWQRERRKPDICFPIIISILLRDKFRPVVSNASSIIQLHPIALDFNLDLTELHLTTEQEVVLVFSCVGEKQQTLFQISQFQFSFFAPGLLKVR